MTAPSDFDEQAALRGVVEGTASATGNEFFRSLVENLSRALGVMGGWVATLDAERGELCAMQLKIRDRWWENFVYQVAGTPCETALVERRVVHVPERVVELYGSDPRLRAHGAVSYLGVPLFAADGRIIGQLGVLDDKPMRYEPRAMAIFQIFANRAAAELERLKADRALVEREAQLSQLLEGALDAIVDFDADYRVHFMNPAARRAFGGDASGPEFDVRGLFSEESSQRLQGCVAELLGPAASSSSQWVAGGLQARSPAGGTFQVEATLSHYRLELRDHLTLILRDVDERLSAERRISTLTRETQYLREELRALQSYERVVGSSPALLQALGEVENVAGAETSVLLLGETGTGKELFARTLHSRSKRGHKPLVKLNCGAIPHGLIESELFGHERGAFTGATQRREGRFALADGGTLFLDEIGELPLALQPKLLRVLQEGEFEPVGSSRTIAVDVRIVAATNRDLSEEVRAGRFREDLFYRLSVFPIRIPPLRERASDVDELARVFFDKYTRRLGRPLAPLSEPTLERLRRYPWPGNVRELENVIERGVIVSTFGVFDLDRALPELARQAPRPEAEPRRVRNANEMLELERANISLALEQCAGKVAGASGAAVLLGMRPSTLASRIQSLGIRRPAR